MHIQPGILAFQGDIEEHEAAVASLGLRAYRVKTIADLKAVTHLIIPGGESTVISKFLRQYALDTAIIQQVKNGTLAVYGTCAGMIVLSSHIDSPVPITNLSLINIHTSRNAYGSQIDSFEKDLEFTAAQKTLHAVFIRAPKCTAVGSDVQVLMQDADTPVLFQQKRVLASSFHPEYCRPALIHQYFFEM